MKVAISWKAPRSISLLSTYRISVRVISLPKKPAQNGMLNMKTKTRGGKKRTLTLKLNVQCHKCLEIITFSIN